MESLATSVVVGHRYRLGALLGEGGMARVFDAFDLTLERPVAVKVLRPEADALPDVQRRFQQEARFAAQIHHPHVVAVLDFGEDKGHSYLVMERLSGATLRNEMAAGPLHPQRVVAIVSEMLAALRSAHRHGVLHRDIKPSNVLLQEDGHTKLTDFGIAKGFSEDPVIAPGTDETMTGVVLGTPGYLAPERAAGLPASVQSDLYSVGAVMVEALTTQRVVPGAPLPPGIPPTLLAVAGRALAVDPRARFASSEAMLEALRPPQDHATPVTRPTPRPDQAWSRSTLATPESTATVRSTSAATAAMAAAPAGPRRRHRVRTAVALGGVAACALVGSLFVLLEGSAQTTGQAVPHHSSTVASTHDVATVPTTSTTTTTFITTTTTTLPRHGGFLHHLLHDHDHGNGNGNGNGGLKGGGHGLGLGGTG